MATKHSETAAADDTVSTDDTPIKETVVLTEPPAPRATRTPATKSQRSTAAAEPAGDDHLDRPTNTAKTDGSGSRALTVLAWTLVAVLAITTAVFGYLAFSGAEDGDRQAAVDAASEYAVVMSTFDYRDLDANREAIAEMATEDFASRYAEMVEALGQLLAEGQSQGTAEVTKAAVTSIDGDNAEVMLFVDQQASNVVNPTGRTQPYRMVINLKSEDGRWLVDNVETP